MNPTWLVIGGLYCAVAAAAGAFGAHALTGRVDARALANWETGARYLIYCGLGLLALGAVFRRGAAADGLWAGVCLSLGGAVFAAALAILALGGPRWLGMVAPLGGSLIILGFLLFAWSAWRLGG